MSQQTLWIAYAASNIVAVLLLLASWKRPRLGRLLYFLLFAWAAWVNSNTSMKNPGVYLDYANYAVPIYRDFITNWFSKYITPMVFAIAMGQACIALGMLAKGRIFKLACIGGIVFLLAIAPLGVGAAFPFSLTAGAGLWLLYRGGSERWLWEGQSRAL